MRHITAAVDEARARELLNRGWINRINRMLSPPRPQDAPPRLELIYLPAYFVTIALEKKGEMGEMTCHVDGCSGSFSLVHMGDQIVDGDIDAENFAVTVDESEAERIAREALIKTILRRRGSAGKPVPKETKSIELLRYPYWVYYHQRRRGLMDVKVLDAVTGKPVGNKIKMGILEAFKAVAKQTK